jgi:hypothetical protein
MITIYKNKKKTMAFILQANYTDRATATGQRILVPTFAISGVLSGQCCWNSNGH